MVSEQDDRQDDLRGRDIETRRFHLVRKESDRNKNVNYLLRLQCRKYRRRLSFVTCKFSFDSTNSETQITNHSREFVPSEIQTYSRTCLPRFTFSVENSDLGQSVLKQS